MCIAWRIRISYFRNWNRQLCTTRTAMKSFLDSEREKKNGRRRRRRLGGVWKEKERVKKRWKEWGLRWMNESWNLFRATFKRYIIMIWKGCERRETDEMIFDLKKFFENVGIFLRAFYIFIYNTDINTDSILKTSPRCKNSKHFNIPGN